MLQRTYLAVWCLLLTEVVAAARPVRLDAGVVDTAAAQQQASFQALRTAVRPQTVQQLSVRGSAPWLVQFQDVIHLEWKHAMEAAGGHILGYVPDNALLVEATPKQLQKIGNLPQVVWMGEYLPAYKLSRPARMGCSETKCVADLRCSSLSSRGRIFHPTGV